ncbi:hypothetical protein ABFX02_04G222200 [Erythranthe guttata]
MHGCSSTSVLLVDAEFDSMGGSEVGVGTANRTSPRKAAIEKVQAELRQEFGVRDEWRRELDFLEQGGNPLDFKLGNVASVSVQSTSVTDQHPDQFVTSEAKGGLAFTTSTHGDSVESNRRPEAALCEPNSADNLILLDAEHGYSEGRRSLLHPNRSNVVPSEQSFQMDVSRKTQEHGDSAAFGLPRKAYKRRNRSRPNRDGARSSSTDVNPIRGSHSSSLPSRHGHKDVNGLVSDTENQSISLNWNSKPTSPMDVTRPKTVFTGAQDNIGFDGLKSVKSTKDLIEGVFVNTASDVIASKNPVDEELSQQSFSGAIKTRNRMDSNGPEAIQVLGEMDPAAIECQPSVNATKVEIQSSSCQINGFSSKKGDEMINDDHKSSPSCVIKVLDSESSCTQTSLSNDANNDREKCARVKNVDSNGNLENQTLQDGNPVIESDKFANGDKDTEEIDVSTLVNKESVSACQSQRDTSFSLQPKEELYQSESASKGEVKDQVITEGMDTCDPIQSESGSKPTDPLADNPGLQNETSRDVGHQGSIDVSNLDLPEARCLASVSTFSVEDQIIPESDSKLASSIDEDAILKEAQIIEAKRKRIVELTNVTSPMEIPRKSHWEYVLEEMAWLANDFAQERIWKIAAAAQTCYQVAVTSRLRKQEKCSGMDAKRVAHTLAKAVMGFWHSVEVQIQETNKELKQQLQKDEGLSVRDYAVRLLKCNEPSIFLSQTEVPLTPDRISDSGVLDLSWEDSLTEENLFYSVNPGAMETYRKSIESHVTHCRRIGCTVQEEVETSDCDVATDFEYKDNAYDEDEGETSTYNIPVAFEDNKSSRYGQKKRKHLGHSYGARSYEIGSDLLPMPSTENNLVSQQYGLAAKRPGSSLNVSVPTKRLRTASRRVISPFNAGASGYIQMPNKTEASSCDTNSFQDDQSIQRGRLLVPNSVEVDSAGAFERKLPFDSAEVSLKPKKTKKAKHLNSSYEQRWQVDSSFQNEQFRRDQWKKGLDGHQLESNGNCGLLGQPVLKKPKLIRQSQDSSFDNIPPSGGSVPSPVASQMSNMSNPNKFIKMLGGRDRGRKSKALKMPFGQSGSGSIWSLFEDQALVVLAHDLGPNWELVSDAINNTVQKCIYRKAKECKVRHSFLMDRSPGDGADSAEDSGSSQPYSSTLRGIPKGSARQLFQRLQGPMEEETVKSHFAKITMIAQKQHCRKTQDPIQLQQPHSSHTVALSEVCPNNLNGGPVLTPLDLCDTSVSGPDILSLGYQGPLSSGLAIPNQGSPTPSLPASGASSALQGSSNMMIGNTFSSPHGPLSSSARDGRYVPRSGSLSADEQQRMQQYNQMIPGRNIPQPNTSSAGIDRGVRVLPGGNGMGVMGGVNRSLPMARPGFQGIPSSSNSGNMASPGNGMSSANMHAGIGAGQGSSMLRPREAVQHMMRDSPRQMMAPELQMPGNSQGMSHFGSPPVSSYPIHHPISPQPPQVLSPRHPHFQGPANHVPNPQQQAYAAARLAKERQLQNRILQQQKQFAASDSLMSPHVQSQPQLPISSPMQNSSQVNNNKPQQTSSPPVSVSPSMNSVPPQHQPNHQKSAQGAARNGQAGGSGLTNHTGNKRQRQPNQFSQANRQHPQQRQQQLQAQQAAKAAKGVGRGNLSMHQNIHTDTSLLNGVSANLGEKGEPVSFTGSPLNTGQQVRPFASQGTNQSLPQQKMYSGQASSSSRNLQSNAQSDNSSKGQFPPVSPPVSSGGNQSGTSLTTTGLNHQQGPSQQKLANQNQPVSQRVVVQPNRQINPDASTKPQVGDSDTEIEASNNATNAVQVVSPTGGHKWHNSEPLSDSNALKSPTNLSSLVSVPSNSSESVPQAGQGLSQRSSSASLPQIRHDQQPQQQSQQPQQQQSQQPQQHQPPLHSQQVVQLLQAGNGNLFGRSTESRLE